MSSSTSEIITFIIVISTGLLLVFGLIIARYIFLYQQKRYRHQKEVLQLRESFTQTLLQSKIEIQEQTLDHISKELHANIGQLVSLININLSELLIKNKSNSKDEIIETKLLVKQLLSELKYLSAGLNTDHIAKIGFHNALSNELKMIQKTKKYEVIFETTGNIYRFPSDQEIILLRLCQEALNNALKYSNATLIKVMLFYDDMHVILEILDNGIGFTLSEANEQISQNSSTGIINMQKRAKLMNAILEIDSKLNRGTSVKITISK
jgi:signal transduction histidine kinase